MRNAALCHIHNLYIMLTPFKQQFPVYFLYLFLHIQLSFNVTLTIQIFLFFFRYLHQFI